MYTKCENRNYHSVKRFVVVIVSLAFLIPLPRAAQDPAWVIVGRAKRLYYREGETGKALKLLNDANADAPSADAHALIGAIYFADAKANYNEAILALAALHFRTALQHAETFFVPSDEIETYFKLLAVYQLLGYEHEHSLLIAEIELFASRRDDPRIAGRLHYELGDYYISMHRDTRADESYRLAYEKGYRPQSALVKRSHIARMLKNHMQEKRLLLIAETYERDPRDPGSAAVAEYIASRLTALGNVTIPPAYATPTY